MNAPSTNPFPNYTQMRQTLPIKVWHVLRVVSVLCALAMIVTLFVSPKRGLSLWWGYTVPVLPLIFFAAPGLWRNICPMAALNQTPRLLRFSRGLTLPPRFKEYAYVLGMAAFFVIVATRRVLFNNNGVATGFLLLAMLGVAFVGGVVFKGKGGWCSSGVCPLFAVQRVYGQTPFAVIPNSHCQPCVGCAKNCYDFNPRVAYIADMTDDDPRYSGYRKFFVGAFPGLILGFYQVPGTPTMSVARTYGEIAAYVLASAGVFSLLERFVKVTPYKLTVVFGASALNIYYWYNTALYVQRLLHHKNEAMIWGGRAAVLAATLVWLARSLQKERVFQNQTAKAPVPARAGAMGGTSISLRGSQALRRSQRLSAPEITVQPDDKHFVVVAGRSLLDIAEANSLKIEAGCRMGVCGADPIAVLGGMDNLALIDDDEQNTLDRLGLATNTRLACKAHVYGDCTIALKPERPKAFASSMIRGATRDPSVNTIVIIGNGIAGVTAADHVRRRHPGADIHLVAREKHHLYNRMGIERLIYGRTAMSGLYLQEDRWYEDLVITTWLNTRALRIERAAKQVVLGSGETLSYDRLILATGAQSTVPAIDRFGLPGTFVMREADDALAIRSFAQQHECRHALVAGGGLLGLEAAHALHRLGMNVSVLERSDGLLRRQLDQRAATMLREYLDGLGLATVTRAETTAVNGDDRIHEVVLKDGRVLPCDLLLVAAGITPNVDLARDAGLEVKRGVIVDDMLCTSDPNIYAVGDVAEHKGIVHGLWPAAAEQAQIAAANALGDRKHYEPVAPATMLKVVGVDLASIGQVDAAGPDEIEIVLEDTAEHRYRKLVIAGDNIVGAILFGYPLLSPAVSKAIRDRVDVRGALDQLQAGNWDVLSGLRGAPVLSAHAARVFAPGDLAAARARTAVGAVSTVASPAAVTPTVAPLVDASPVDASPVDASPVAALRLRIVAGPERGRSITVDEEGTVLGRAPDSSGRISDPQISRAHARIDWRDGRFLLTDLASANGTFLNYEPIAGPVALSTGDVISIGDSRIVVNVG